jgi:multiple sugar transport system substrate-binding protein
MNQWTDPRGVGTFFGSGSLVADDGSAQIPAAWEDAWRWTYAGWWEDWFIPNGPYGGAEFLQGPGGPFSSGNLAMMHNHLWYVATWALGEVNFNWDLAATPSYNGEITSKMHADTFGILKGSKNPEAAFTGVDLPAQPRSCAAAPRHLRRYARAHQPARILAEQLL